MVELIFQPFLYFKILYKLVCYLLLFVILFLLVITLMCDLGIAYITIQVYGVSL